MPTKAVLRKARKDKRQGKAPSTQAGEFVREEIHHVREGKHGARSTKQAIAIGLSKARKAGVDLPPPKTGSKIRGVRPKASRDTTEKRPGKPSRARAQSAHKALEREPRSTASHAALSRQAKSTARKRTPAERSATARKAARTRARRRTSKSS